MGLNLAGDIENIEKVALWSMLKNFERFGYLLRKGITFICRKSPKTQNLMRIFLGNGQDFLGNSLDGDFI